MIQAAPALAHDLYGMGQDLCRRLAPSPAPSPPQGKRASLRRRRSVGSAPANGIDAVKWTASIAFGSCTPSGTGFRIIGRSSGEKLPREKMPAPTGKASVEIYQQAIRYIAMTGDTLPNSVDYLKDLTDIIPLIYKELDRAHPKGKMKSKSKGGRKRRARGGEARLTAILEAGVGPSEQYPPKSEQHCAYVAESIRQGKDDVAIVEALLTLEPAHAISQHIAEQHEEPRIYVERQVRQIREKVEAEEAKALTDAEARLAAINEEYAFVLAG